jgi:hypothetical protein
MVEESRRRVGAEGQWDHILGSPVRTDQIEEHEEQIDYRQEDDEEV